VREPVCSDYRVYTVCGMPPPSSGGIAVAQMLGMFETRDMARWRQSTACRAPDAVHLFSEVGRLAYADRDRYAADTDFVPLPGRGLPALIDKAYLANARSPDRRTLDGRSAGRQSAGRGRGLGQGQRHRNAIRPRTWSWSTATAPACR
jgi:gamma-glutamyltranspeptidase/glutathione hydrolase